MWEEREEWIWDLLAYAGRYGHQSLDVTGRLPVRELRKFNRSVSNIVKEEKQGS